MALLIIDELGFEPMTREEASLFFRLVTYRYGRGAILITTNKSSAGVDRAARPATRCWRPPFSIACCTGPTFSTSRAGAIGCATWRTPRAARRPE